MAVMTKPVNRTMVTTDKDAEIMRKNVKKEVIERIRKNSERIRRQTVAD